MMPLLDNNTGHPCNQSAEFLNFDVNTTHGLNFRLEHDKMLIFPKVLISVRVHSRDQPVDPELGLVVGGRDVGCRAVHQRLGLADGVEAGEDQAEAHAEGEDIEQLGSSLPHGQWLNALNMRITTLMRVSCHFFHTI